MSVTARDRALRQGLRPIPGFVLAVLADAANEKNTCWPRTSTLADRAVTPSRRLCQGGGDTGVTPLTTRRTQREPPPRETKAEPELELPDRGGGNICDLHYPKDLLSPERTRAQVMMGALDPPLDQQVLNEWAGIIHAGGIRASPLLGACVH